MTKVTDLRLERRLRRIAKPDGNCAHCERAADRHHPVGPLVVRLSEPDEPEGVIYEFCCWECLAHWAAVQAGMEPP